MPLTNKGRKIMNNMQRTYGGKKGEQVFYATRNAGKITGVEETSARKSAGAIGYAKGGKTKSKSRVNEAGNYTKPGMRKRIFNRIKAGGKGGRPGQWSARKAQMLASAYKKAGGGYRGLVMIHVFLLFVFLGIGEDKRQVSADMYFRDLNECVWFAQKLHKQGKPDDGVLPA